MSVPAGLRLQPKSPQNYLVIPFLLLFSQGACTYVYSLKYDPWGRGDVIRAEDPYQPKIMKYFLFSENKDNACGEAGSCDSGTSIRLLRELWDVDWSKKLNFL